MTKGQTVGKLPPAPVELFHTSESAASQSGQKALVQTLAYLAVGKLTCRLEAEFCLSMGHISKQIFKTETKILNLLLLNDKTLSPNGTKF